MKLNHLPLVDRMQGVAFEESPSGDPGAGLVELQYTDRSQKWHALKMPALDAMTLLNMLEQVARDEGIDHLRRPPETSS